MAALAVVTSACEPATTSATSLAESEFAAVSRIYDGDTISVDIGGQVDVRLLGINAPEDGECFADEARDHLVETLDGHMVRLERNEIDQFGRTLAVVFDGDRNVNLELVELGLAIATTPGSDDAPGTGFIDAESRAADLGLGLWSIDSCGQGPIPDLAFDRAGSVVDSPGPDDENLGGELIAIHNSGPKKVNLNGWVLRDESSRHRYRFAPGTQIDAGETVRVASDDAGWDPGGTPVWNNDGDIVILLDRHGRVIDHWRYGSN